MGKTLRPFDRMRHNRRNAECRPPDVEAVTWKQVVEDLPKSMAIVDRAEELLDDMSPF